MPLQIDNALFARHYRARILHVQELTRHESLMSQLREREELWAFPLAGDLLIYQPHSEQELQMLRDHCRDHSTTFVVAALPMIRHNRSVSAFAEGIRGKVRGSEREWKLRFWWYKLVDTINPTF